MAQRLLVVHGDQAEAERLASPYRDRGWEVECVLPSDAETVDVIAETKPLAAVFCIGNGEAGVMTALAEQVLSDARTLRPLMVFLGGEPTDVPRLKTEVPFGVFVNEDELPWVLKHLAFRF